MHGGQALANKDLIDKPVLVVLIGWARYYDGTETIVGGHRHLQSNPDDNGEMQAFVRQSDGYFRCGAGKGEIHEDNADIVFIARNPRTLNYEVVALYRGCGSQVDPEYNWCTVQTKRAVLFPVGRRPHCSVWPAGQGMRRWAHRIDSRGPVREALLSVYEAALKRQSDSENSVHTNIDPELSAFEGEQRELFIRHRRRESALRATKIRQALRESNGHLVCEVPNCGFDFLNTYGEDGRNFAIVHHKRPLSWAPSNGAKTSLTDLAIVCANCHAMIHRGGKCRKMALLIEKKS